MNTNPYIENTSEKDIEMTANHIGSAVRLLQKSLSNDIGEPVTLTGCEARGLILTLDAIHEAAVYIIGGACNPPGN